MLLFMFSRGGGGVVYLGGKNVMIGCIDKLVISESALCVLAGESTVFHYPVYTTRHVAVTSL